MGEKIVVGPVNRGLKTDRTAFVIDNDAFPTLINAYQWRGRVKRKRGTSLLGRLQRRVINTNLGGTIGGAVSMVFDLYGALGISVSQPNASIVPGSVGIAVSAPDTSTFIDNGNGTFTVSGNGNAAGSSINYTTGLMVLAFTIPLVGGATILMTTISYNPTLPVMGLEDLILQPTLNTGNIAFDTVYSYNINTTSPYDIYDVSFYKNPATGSYPGYTQKTTWTPTTWNGQDYQQFWTTNYQGALWATNGVNVPFTVTNIGMQYYGPSTALVLSAAVQTSPTTVNFTVVGNNLVVGDFVFANEFIGGSGLNFQTGYVTTAGNVFTVTFPNATIAAGAYTPGILQLLTNRSDTTKDSIRWYDGDPTNGISPYTTLATGKGWVNFAPPLSQRDYGFSGLIADQYYLVGARMIVPFKDRLLFIGPVVQTSAAGSQVYLQDTIIYSQNGTPFYTASYTNTPSATVDNPTSPTNVFNPILVSSSQSAASTTQTATSPAFFFDQTGFGGSVIAGVGEPIITASPNRDVLILGFSTSQVQLVYTGDDILPFQFYSINSELGSTSTFSIINMDAGVITKGSRGYVISSQTAVERIDVQIPDQVFQVRLLDNGNERVTAQRDFINEWAYFTYPSNEMSFKFPNQTLLYNYRDDSYALFNECYTTYGIFRKRTGYTWAAIGSTYATWNVWNDPWNAGSSSLLKPEIIGGNQQGFVIFRSDGTGESHSLYIQSFSGSVVTSPNHGLSTGDYIVISGAIGTISSEVNGKIFKVSDITTDTFTLDPPIGTGTYLGGGVIKRMYVPFIQTKQFPVAWGMGRKTRIGPQQYLLSYTNNGQITLQIYLSQNNDNAYNSGTIIPNTLNLNNSSLIYSSVLYTCPESTNLGLTPANTNLQMLTSISSDGQSANNQKQIWHRVNTSLIGDTVQLGFTMSDEQMRDTQLRNQFTEIEIHGFILDVSPSQMLS